MKVMIARHGGHRRTKHEAIFYERLSPTWLRRPTLNSYEEAVFAVPTFFTAIIPFREVLRGLQSLINPYFAGISRHFITVQERCKVTSFFDMCSTPRVRRLRCRFSWFAAGNAGCERMIQSAESN